MGDSKSVVSNGAYGIPKWIMKKGMRYEVDDFIVSPPSLDDGGFLRLRYGHTATNQASLQGMGQEGGLTIEVKDDTLQFSSDSTTATTSDAAATTISIGPGGLSVEPSPNTTPEATTRRPPVHPLLVLPMNFGSEPKFVVKVNSSHSPNTNKDSLGPTAPLLSKESTSTENINVKEPTTLVEKVQTLSLNTTPVPTPVTSPRVTPKHSPTFPRKHLGIGMEPVRRISAHSYFCTKQYRNQDSMNLDTNIKQDLSSSVTIKEVDEHSLPPEALDSKFMGKRRRQPKPSALREMNFWAPTSM